MPGRVSVLFVAFVFGLALAQAVLPDRAFSDEENRVLQQVPAVSAGAVLSGRLQQESEDYIADQFAGRDGWIALKSALERLSGKKENNGVYLGREETLLRRYDEADAARLEQNAAAVERFAAQCPAETYAAFVPSSTEIWADRLPRWADSADEAAGIRRALGQMPTVRALDVYAALEERAGEEIYYRTDHHWDHPGRLLRLRRHGPGHGADAPGGRGLYPRDSERHLHRHPLLPLGGARHHPRPDRALGARCGADPDRDRGAATAPRRGVRWAGAGGEGPVHLLPGRQSRPGCAGKPGGGQRPPAAAVCAIPSPIARRPSGAQHFAQVHLVDLRYYKQPLSEYVAQHGIDTVVFLYGYESFASDASLTFLQ